MCCGVQPAWYTTNCMPGNCRDTATMSRGWFQVLSKLSSGSPLCAHTTFTPRSCACWTTGSPTAGSSRSKPRPPGPQAVYTLNADTRRVSAVAVMPSSRSASEPEVGRHHVLQQQPALASPGERAGELPGVVGGVERQRIVGFTGAGQVRQQRHGGVAGQEHVVQVHGPVHAGQGVGRGTVRRHHAQHQPQGVRRGGPPRQRRHDVMGVHIDDELAPAAQRLPAPGQLLRRRRPVAAARRRRPGRGPRRAVSLRRARREVDRGQQGRHAPRGLQEQPPVHGQRVRRRGRPVQHRPSKPHVGRRSPRAARTPRSTPAPAPAAAGRHRHRPPCTQYRPALPALTGSSRHSGDRASRPPHTAASPDRPGIA